MSTSKTYDFVAGEILLIDKPLTWTSFDAVKRIRGLLYRKLKVKLKVGHAGTLDPLATGLLIICTGKMTKRIDEFQAQEKEYTGTFRIGATTPGFDLEMEIDETFPTAHLNEDLIRSATAQFTGQIEQVPPHFSAIKVDGKRAYDLARAGKESKLEARTVEISVFELTRIVPNEAGLWEADFRVVCSKGTYIRALARDFGKAVGSGAHLSALRRTRIGAFQVADAISLEALTEVVETLNIPENSSGENKN